MIRCTCKLSVLMLIALCLSACSTNQQKYEEYVEPASSDTQRVATLTGSTNEQPSFFEADSYAYVARIDGKLTRGAPASWGDKIKVLSGSRKIHVGVSLGTDFFGYTEFLLQLDADRTYSVHSTHPEFDWAAWKWKANVWIEDQDGKVLTEKSIVVMEMRIPNSVIFIPI